MTTIAQASGLTAHDHLIGPGEHGPWLSDFHLPWSVGISLHLYKATPLTVRLHNNENRAVLIVGADSAQVNVFVNVDQIDRLITLLTAARQRLS